MYIHKIKLINVISLSCYWLLLVFLGTFAVGCENPTEPTKLNVDRDIPPSENFDASYGFWGPDGSTIYFIHSEPLGSDPDPGKLDQLWKLDLRTGQRRMVHAGRIVFADISSDGKWIVFNSFGLPQYLYKMRSDGTGLQKLTGPGSPNPNWEYTIKGKSSPNRNYILFSLSAGVPRGISIMDKGGANPRVIVPFGTHPNWFPDGSKIIYINWDTTKAKKNQQQVYIANPDGSYSQRITNLKNTTFNIQDPSLSPNNQKVAFIYDDELYIKKVGNKNVEQVTIGLGYVRRPEWSLDGKIILFSRIIPNVSRHLYHLNVYTREVTPVFPAAKNDNPYKNHLP